MGRGQTYFINRDTGARVSPIYGYFQGSYRRYLRYGGFCVLTRNRWQNLAPGRWRFVMRADNAWQANQSVRTHDFVVVPRAPSVLGYHSRTAPDRATLTWNRPAGATGFTVHVYRGNTRVRTSARLGSNVGHLDVTGLNADTQHRFRVVVHSAGGDSNWSAWRYFRTTRVAVPATPGNLRMTGRTQTTITVAWNASARAAHYRVYRNNIFRGTTTGLTWTSNQMSAGTQHHFRVVAVNASGRSGAATGTWWTTAAGGGGSGGIEEDKLRIKHKKQLMGFAIGWVDVQTVLNVWRTPSRANNSNIIRSLSRNTAVTIVGESGDFWRLACGGYVYSKYVRFTNVPLTTGTLPRRFNLVRYTRDTARSRFLGANLPAGYTRQEFENITPAHALGVLHESRVFIFRGHGSRHRIATDSNRNTRSPGEDLVYSLLTHSMIRSLPTNSLRRAELVVFAACGGETGAFNLVNAARERGAQTVIGWREPSYAIMLCRWTEAFMNSLARGNSVQVATVAGNRAVTDAEANFLRNNPNSSEARVRRTLNRIELGDMDRRF